MDVFGVASALFTVWGSGASGAMGAMGAAAAVAALWTLSTLLVSASPAYFNSSIGATLLYTTKHEIRTINALRPGKVSTLVKGLEKGFAVDFYYEGQIICWTDVDLEKIKCASHNGTHTNDKTLITIPGSVSYGLAIDWFTQKLYWTDRETCRIEVASLTHNYRKVLFWSDIDEPRAITVAPSTGLLFWSDWGEVSKIERAAMNGDPSTRQVIVDTDIFWPNALTIDYQTNKLYWLDAKLLFIEVMDFDGKNRHTIMNHLVYPVSLTTFHDKLYWSDWKTWCIYSWDISTRGPVREMIKSEYQPTDVKVWEGPRQPHPDSSHPCFTNNGNCSHLCLLSPNPPGYSCACPTGVKLINDFQCADGPQSQLILVQKMAISRISLDSPDYTSFTLPLKDIKNAVTVDYDNINGYIYWIDSDALSISRSRIDGSNQSVVIQGGIGTLDGIAIDSVAGNIYWTDPKSDTINVARVDGTARKVLINENLTDPRAIALAPSLGWMFWSDWSNPKIERASLDGSDRLLLISDNIGWPNGIALDIKEKKVYWGDAQKHKIEVCNMDGSERRELLSDNIQHIFGMTLLGNYTYWTDWQRRSLSRVHKLTGEEREIVAEQMHSVMGLKAFEIKEKLNLTPCYNNNGNCSHFCFNRPKDYVCGCPINLEFGSDNKTCIKPVAFLLYAKKDKIGRLSIENSNSVNNALLPVKDIKQASALTIHFEKRYIYWADSKLKVIARCSINGSNTEKIIEWINSVDGLAFDWCGQNLYWTDSGTQRIEVSKLDGSHRRVLIWQGLRKPMSIVLDPTKGYMYWSEWGKSIKRAEMDGSNPIVLFDQVGRANALNIDYEKRRLIWVGLDQPIIEIGNLDGSNRRELISKNVKMPYALTLYHDFVYWADWISGEILNASFNSGGNKTVMYTNLETISSMVVYHESRQVGENLCSLNNGGCSHLCLSVPVTSTNSKKYKCACPTHYTLNKDNSTCTAPAEFIMFSHRNGIGRVITGSVDCPDASLPLPGLKSIKALEYDPVHKNIYWVDGRSYLIRYMNENGISEIGVIAKSIQYSTIDMALDAVGRALYFSCPDTNSINVTKLDNVSSVGVVIHGDNIIPKYIAVHPTKRLLFWVNVANGLIMSSSMDGSNQHEIAKAPNITAFTLDPYTDMVYWANSKQIYGSNISGNNKRIIWQGGSVTSLSALKSTLFWIDSEKQLMHLPLNKKDAPARPVLRAPHVTDIVAVYKVDYKNLCMNGGNCAGVCLAGGSCGCIRGLSQGNGGRCNSPPPCESDKFACKSTQSSHTVHLVDKNQSPGCIPLGWRCDGQTDCADASDELNCNKCPEGKFKCFNDDCIDEMYVCDGSKHCSDGHDEAQCCTEAQSFRCPSTGVCIRSNFLCDQINHCPDGADESTSICIQNLTESSSNITNLYKFGMPFIIILLLFAFGFYYCCKRMQSSNHFTSDDKASDPLSPKQTSGNPKVVTMCPSSGNSETTKMGKKLIERMRMSSLNGSSTNSYDRNHITGASSSVTNGSSFLGRYPREPLNPPPSPATTAPSSSAVSRHRPYRHYRVINQPPPPTPCSTDVCDESDCAISYPIYLEAPPPTPCPPSPPSPSSRSSTYFSPFPPPPSPAPPHYDS